MVSRLYIGGLDPSLYPPTTTTTPHPLLADLAELISRFAKVQKVEWPDGTTPNSFAYVTIDKMSAADLLKWQTIYSGTKWKGMQLKISQAKPHYIDIMANEKRILKQKQQKRVRKQRRRLHALLQVPNTINDHDLNAVLAKRPNWVTGRYNRALPTRLRIIQPSSGQMMVIEAKHVFTQIKRLTPSIKDVKAIAAEEAELQQIQSQDLTWFIEEDGEDESKSHPIAEDQEVKAMEQESLQWMEEERAKMKAQKKTQFGSTAKQVAHGGGFNSSSTHREDVSAVVDVGSKERDMQLKILQSLGLSTPVAEFKAFDEDDDEEDD